MRTWVELPPRRREPLKVVAPPPHENVIPVMRKVPATFVVRPNIPGSPLAPPTPSTMTVLSVQAIGLPPGAPLPVQTVCPWRVKFGGPSKLTLEVQVQVPAGIATVLPAD